MLPVEVGRRVAGDEELRAVGIWAGIGLDKSSGDSGSLNETTTPQGLPFEGRTIDSK